MHDGHEGVSAAGPDGHRRRQRALREQPSVPGPEFAFLSHRLHSIVAALDRALTGLQQSLVPRGQQAGTPPGPGATASGEARVDRPPPGPGR